MVVVTIQSPNHAVERTVGGDPFAAAAHRERETD